MSKAPGNPPLLSAIQDTLGIAKAWKDWFSRLMSWLRTVTLPAGGALGQALIKSSGTDFDVSWGTVSSSSGTVTSVALSLPAEFTVTGSPVTSIGTLAAAWASETQHYVMAAPSGSSGTPSFRALVASDIPALSYIGGSTGSTDNALLRADGTGAATAQATSVIVSDANEITGYYGAINLQTGTTYTLASSDAGKIVECSNSSAITVTLPNSLGAGFTCTVVQTGAGQVTFSAASGASFAAYSSKTKIAGQDAGVMVYVRSNSGGSSAVYRVMGTMA